VEVGPDPQPVVIPPQALAPTPTTGSPADVDGEENSNHAQEQDHFHATPQLKGETDVCL
jgi:hypothetical protein